jgi:hypothetical protein
MGKELEEVRPYRIEKSAVSARFKPFQLMPKIQEEERK